MRAWLSASPRKGRIKMEEVKEFRRCAKFLNFDSQPKGVVSTTKANSYVDGLVLKGGVEGQRGYETRRGESKGGARRVHLVHEVHLCCQKA